MPDEVPLNERTQSEDIQRTHEVFESPAWHKGVLEESRRRAESGEDQFSDWIAAKEEIRRRVL